MHTTNKLDHAEIRRLQSKVIYFGHQSVGNNIVHGLESILKTTPDINLSILEAQELDKISTGVFAHSRVGENFNPKAKDNDFTNIINMLSSKVNLDCAFYKYCYIDIRSDTDIYELFSHYNENYQRLRKLHPEITFIHITTPITVVQKGLRAWVKKIIGRPIGGYADNIKRNDFNDLMRSEYYETELVFDLARLESTHQNGNRELFRSGNARYEALVPEYASDGRHLNLSGSEYIARELLNYLAEIL